MKVYRIFKGNPVIRIVLNGVSKTIEFKKNIMPKDYCTYNKAEQKALESHPYFNKLFFLSYSEQAENSRNEEITESRKKEITETDKETEKIEDVTTTQQAKAWLRSKDIEVANSASIETVKKIAMENGFEFNNLKLKNAGRSESTKEHEFLERL
jgi:hypothetical protein